MEIIEEYKNKLEIIQKFCNEYYPRDTDWAVKSISIVGPDPDYLRIESKLTDGRTIYCFLPRELVDKHNN